MLGPLRVGLAERLAAQVQDPDQRTEALAAVARALVDDYPYEAARLARMIREPAVRDEIQIGIAAAFALVDLEQAGLVVEDIADDGTRAQAFAAVARCVRNRDPQVAEEFVAYAEEATGLISDDGARAEATAAIAYALHAGVPEIAERLAAEAEAIAHALPDAWQRASALAKTAKAFALIDPEHAERITRSIPDDGWKIRALAEIATTLASTSANGAARIASMIADPEAAAEILLTIVRLVLGNPGDTQ